MSLCEQQKEKGTMTKKYIIKEIKFQVAVDATWTWDNPNLTNVIDMLGWEEIESNLSGYHNAVVLPGTLQEHSVIDGKVIPHGEDFLGSPSLHFEIWETAYTSGHGDLAMWFTPEKHEGLTMRNQGKENWFVLGHDDGGDEKIKRIDGRTVKNGIRSIIRDKKVGMNPLQKHLKDMQRDEDVSHILDTDDCDLIIQYGLFGMQVYA